MQEEIYTAQEFLPNKKPVFEKAAQNRNIWLRTGVSLVLYILAYYIFFHRDIAWIFILTIAIILHEGGHYIVMKIFRYKDVYILFVPFLGAYVSGSPQRISQKQRIITLLAGPLPGIVIGMISLWVFLSTSEVVYYKLSLIFILLNVFNLLPVSPLDGGQILENLFVKTGKAVQPYLLIASAVCLFYIAVALHNYIIIFFVWFIVIRFRSIQRISAVRKELDTANIAYNKNYEELSDDEYMIIRKALIIHIPALKEYDPERISEEEDIIVSYTGKILTGSINMDLSKNQKKLVLSLWIGFIFVPVAFFIYASPHLTL
ncbi:MAG: hypothetical protein JST63_03775 [Bacteroidetes bacterium]|nr:hypothetical protein [Bacteroidota bacterium]